MKIKQTTSALAIATLLATAGVAAADVTSLGTAAFEGSVSVLSPDQTGFIVGGQVSVNGLGSGSLTMTRSVANMSLTGSASSAPTAVAGALSGVNSAADVTSTLDFSRSITTSGSLVGQGNVVSRGEAIAALGSAGAASANTSLAGVNAGGEGSATAEATAQGSLNGSLSTSNTLQLLGTSGLFAGSNGLTVGETNSAVAYGSADITADNTLAGVVLNGATIGGSGPTGDGALFDVTSTLTGDSIAMSVSNAGNGTISITTSTGGFFTGGGAAGGATSFVDSGSFFASPD